MNAEWYWLNGTPYCAECVECGGPAIVADEATRGPAPSGGRCACCGETAPAATVPYARLDATPRIRMA